MGIWTLVAAGLPDEVGTTHKKEKLRNMSHHGFYCLK